MIKKNKLTTTTLAPNGKDVKTKKAIKNDTIEIKADENITCLNFLNTCIDESAGKIIILEISNVPIILIPITIVIAVRDANKILNDLVCIPVALANDSSNVTENILLYSNKNVPITSVLVINIMIKSCLLANITKGMSLKNNSSRIWRILL